MIKRMIELFENVFQTAEKPRVFFAPGRVNLIGEHTDYNGGHVFPCALTIGTYAAVLKRADRCARFYSENFKEEGICEIHLDQINEKRTGSWTDYAVGVLLELMKIGVRFPYGFDVVYYGTIPNQSGLSSSASIEVLTGFFLSQIYDDPISGIDLAKLSQRAENEYIGVACGIMDQFAIAMGKQDKAIFLDTNTLTYEYANIILKDITLIVSCSNKKRKLSDSKYNERRSECEQALDMLKEVVDIHMLCDLSIEEYEKYKYVIKDDRLRKRAKHVIYENQRTLMAKDALKVQNIALFGELMYLSHQSLRDEYEVTGLELDTLYHAAKTSDGVLGSRMTGAGFGGCSISLVKDRFVDSFIERVGDIYQKTIGYDAGFYPVKIGDGPSELKVEGR